MRPLLRIPKPRREDRVAGGFTLVEVMIAITVLAVFVMSSLTALTQLNRYAAAARLQTLARAIAQTQIDQIMTTPWSVSGTVPTILAVGTTTQGNVPLDNDNFNNQPGLSSPFTSLDMNINATMTTVIASVSTRIVSASVTVTWPYRGTNYSITLNTLRTADDI
jgi:prepilin-type N-terminal cleavage/methylation domain-containing protein